MSINAALLDQVQLDPEGPSLEYDALIEGELCALIDELKAQAGDDWEEMRYKLPMLKDFAKAVECTQTRGRGEIPAHYTDTVICTRCGRVPTFPGGKKAPGEDERTIEGCPWCFQRARGLPVPKAAAL